MDKIEQVDINLITPNSNQPRKYFDEESIIELSKSIKEYGILNPILVRKKKNLYEIIAGERRYRAAKKIGLTNVPVIIKELDDIASAEIALVENLQRENINPIEEAKSYKQILKEANITEQRLSEIIGKSQSYIANKLRLLTLPNNVQDALIQKLISERHARSLIKVTDLEKQTELLNRIIKEKITVKELDNIIAENITNEEEIKTAIDEIIKSLNISDLEIKEKEEKESDNMNNGNFFPNLNPNPENNQNMSLNSMNMQTMNNGPMPSYQVPNFSQNEQMMQSQPIPETPMPASPMYETPVYNPVSEPVIETPITPEIVQPAPVNNGFEVPQMDQNIQYTPTPEVNNQPTETIALMPAYQPEVPQMEQSQMVDQPLFTTPQPADTIQNQGYDIPVNNQPAPVEYDKLTKLKDFLAENSIEYKFYSNENKNCIIVEL